MRSRIYWVLGFTLVEIMVAVVIVILLASVWFYSYSQSLSWARDAVRKSDFAMLEAQLLNHKRIYWSFPVPWNNFEIHNRWYRVATQWLLDRNVWIEGANILPIDPLTESNYIYSISRNRQEFQIAWTLENDDIYMSLLRGNYVSVSSNILPTIVLAYNGTGNIEINPSVWSWNTNRDSFIFDQSLINLPYSFDTWNPVSRWSFNDLLNEAQENNFWQSSSFRNCAEIWNAWKQLDDSWSSDEYQIRSNTWILENQLCTCTSNWCTEV